jgi:hypothetical protein
METSFSPSFFKSLDVMRMHNTWWYKTYSVFKHKIPAFIKNVYRFRKDLWEYRTYDYRYVLSVLKTSLEGLKQGLENGYEVRETRDKKIEKISRVIRFLENKIADDYIIRAEMELGGLKNFDFKFVEVEGGNYQLSDDLSEEDMYHNRKIFKRADEIEISEWNEVWDTIKANDSESYKTGSGMMSWWD